MTAKAKKPKLPDLRELALRIDAAAENLDAAIAAYVAGCNEHRKELPRDRHGNVVREANLENPSRNVRGAVTSWQHLSRVFGETPTRTHMNLADLWPNGSPTRADYEARRRRAAEPRIDPADLPSNTYVDVFGLVREKSGKLYTPPDPKIAEVRTGQAAEHRAWLQQHLVEEWKPKQKAAHPFDIRQAPETAEHD